MPSHAVTTDQIRHVDHVPAGRDDSKHVHHGGAPADVDQRASEQCSAALSSRASALRPANHTAAVPKRTSQTQAGTTENPRSSMPAMATAMHRWTSLGVPRQRRPPDDANADA